MNLHWPFPYLTLVIPFALRGAALTLNAAAPDVPPSVGEPFGQPRNLDETREQLATEYGQGFSDAAFALPIGVWSEPIASKFGWHLVKILERHAAQPASFEEARGKLPLLYLAARQQEAVDKFLRQAEQRYRVTIDGRPLPILPASGRLAPVPNNEVD